MWKKLIHLYFHLSSSSAAETKKYIEELEADIMPIDNLICFAESEAGTQVFGADTAKNVAAILEKKDFLLL